jgi:hypothetical protein
MSRKWIPAMGATAGPKLSGDQNSAPLLRGSLFSNSQRDGAGRSASRPGTERGMYFYRIEPNAWSHEAATRMMGAFELRVHPVHPMTQRHRQHASA